MCASSTGALLRVWGDSRHSCPCGPAPGPQEGTQNGAVRWHCSGPGAPQGVPATLRAWSEAGGKRERDNTEYFVKGRSSSSVSALPRKKSLQENLSPETGVREGAGAGQPVLGEFIQQFVLPAALELLQPWLHPSEPGCAKLGAAGAGTGSWARGSHWKDLYTLLSLRHSPEGFTARLW